MITFLWLDAIDYYVGSSSTLITQTLRPLNADLMALGRSTANGRTLRLGLFGKKMQGKAKVSPFRVTRSSASEIRYEAIASEMTERVPSPDS